MILLLSGLALYGIFFGVRDFIAFCIARYAFVFIKASINSSDIIFGGRYEIPGMHALANWKELTDELPTTRFMANDVLAIAK